jgi:hypothetical protein
MELHTIQVTNFRSIKDSGVVPIDDIICLVGKNESGKTNLLQALVRMNPAPGQPRLFDVNDDYPRAEASTMEHKLADKTFPRPVAVTVEYRLDDGDIAAVATKLGDGVFNPQGNPRTVKVTIDYDRNKIWSIAADEERAIAKVVADTGVEGVPTTTKRIAEFVEMLNRVVGSAAGESEEAKAKAQAALDVVAGWRESNLVLAVIDVLSKREPLYIYFDQYATLPASGNVRELLTKRQNDEDSLDNSERTFLSLIDEAQINLERLNTQEYPELRNGLESASIRISDELNEYWSQNERSRIVFDHTYKDVPGEEEGSRRDLILILRVEDTKYHVSTSIARRSTGFVWFFSFMVNFSRIRDEFPDQPLVLLLDEPGTSLHGLAQRDFLKVLDGKLGEHQIAYTTHQPFLVDPDRLDRARPVVEEDDDGTKVRRHAYKVDNDTLFPLQAALGYAIGQTLFVAPNVLLVEGTSDLIYLQLLSRAVERKKKVGLDRRWTITPVGGIDKMDTFARLFKGQQLNIAALVDNVGSRQPKLGKLVEDDVLAEEQIVKVAEFVGLEDADIEDLFGIDFYLRLVHGVPEEHPTKGIYAAIKADGLPPAEDQPRITKRIDAALANFQQQDRLDHVPPALYFERHQGELLDALDNDTIGRSEKLFARINDLLTA